MAKKTKARKKRTMARPQKVLKARTEPLSAVHLLGIAGGVITLLAGILWFLGNLFLWKLEAFAWWSFGDLGFINIVTGLVLLITGATLKKNFLLAGIILLIFSIIALIAPPAGFVVGPVLAIIGAVIALAKAAQK